MANPSTNHPVSPRHPDASDPIGVFGDTQPAKPIRPVDVGVSIFVDAGPMNAGS